MTKDHTLWTWIFRLAPHLPVSMSPLMLFCVECLRCKQNSLQQPPPKPKAGTRCVEGTRSRDVLQGRGAAADECCIPA
ncbi:hypothetical protein PVAP13_5KG144307 [Panicum virgatum]|uniref:Secreted protein n=1 Tax=Panicum virgatum TaxID=38727 RepID=A0A8T0SC66_PANVG|nr:hypothetical protein PVAP13_5KG144307 [Panicum virgatum]